MSTMMTYAALDALPDVIRRGVRTCSDCNHDPRRIARPARVVRVHICTYHEGYVDGWRAAQAGTP